MDDRGAHRRLNPLTGRWVLVSAGRTKRPWLGKTEPEPAERAVRHDPGCYLCPGTTRATGKRNPEYAGTYAFDNDFPGLTQGDDGWVGAPHPLLRAEAVTGTCRVLCFSPRHDLTLATMSPEGVAAVVDLWAEQVAELGRTHRWVQVFENRGATMGASNPHPHGQVWASSSLPHEAALEDHRQREHMARGAGNLLDEYVRFEVSTRERVVVEGEEWVATVPFWAVWPYELLLAPRRRVADLTEIDDLQRRDLVIVLGKLLSGYDRLFGRSFPYSMGWHGSPFPSELHWQVHAHFYPPLLTPDRTKFMVGYEMLAEPQRDLTPEDAATQLREAALLVPAPT